MLPQYTVWDCCNVVTGEKVRIVRESFFGETLTVNKFQRIAWQGYAAGPSAALKLAAKIPFQEG